MSLLDDVRAAGLDARLTDDGRVHITGPADVRDRLRDAIRRQRGSLILDLRYEADPCCRDGPHRCDHVWCDECDDWGNDTGFGCSAHPRHTGQRGCGCECCDGWYWCERGTHLHDPDEPCRKRRTS